MVINGQNYCIVWTFDIPQVDVDKINLSTRMQPWMRNVHHSQNYISEKLCMHVSFQRVHILECLWSSESLTWTNCIWTSPPYRGLFTNHHRFHGKHLPSCTVTQNHKADTLLHLQNNLPVSYSLHWLKTQERSLWSFPSWQYFLKLFIYLLRSILIYISSEIHTKGNHPWFNALTTSRHGRSNPSRHTIVFNLQLAPLVNAIVHMFFCTFYNNIGTIWHSMRTAWYLKYLQKLSII